MLRTLGVDCGFAKLEDELRLQLAFGALDPKVLQKAMAAKTDFATLYDFARGLETARIDARSIAAAAASAASTSLKHESAYHLSHHSSRPKALQQSAHTNKSQDKCGKCGRGPHANGEEVSGAWSDMFELW